MSKLSTEKRNQLTDSDFGIPEKRMYPLHDKAHVESAVKLFGHAETKYKKSLARKILSRAREYGMDTSGWKQVLTFAQEQVPPMSNGTSIGNSPPRLMAPYYDEQDELLERVNDLDGAVDPFVFAKRIVSIIHDQVEKDSKPPTGNQNCQLCTWCAEARYRGINALPRPIYSPRDPALSIVGETIVANPVKQKIHNQRQVVETVRGAVDSRWYVHVNWKDSTGGHEFLMINIKDYAYIMDAQAGMLKELDELDSTNSYFRDINYANSYMVRLDTKKFNTELFMSTNDPSKVLPWKNSLDIPYMRDHGMLAPGADDDPRFRRVFVPSEEGLKYLKEDPELSQYWEDMHKATKGEFLVDRDTGEAIGHAFVHTNKKDKGFIFNVEVTPKYRRQGYGWILIDDAVRRFGGEDLTVDADNTPAINLYLQYGFTIYKKGQWHYDPPKDELWMKYDRSKLKPIQESVTQEGVVGKVIAGGITIFALINLAIAVKDAIKKKRYEKNTPTDGKLLRSIEKLLTYYNDLEYKDFLTDTGIRYEYIHDTMEDFDSHLKTIIKYTTECINTTSNCYKSNEKMFKEFFTECKTTRAALWDIVCKLDDHVKDYDVDEHCIDKTAMKYRKHYKTLLEQLMKHIEKFLKTLQKTIDSKDVVQESVIMDFKDDELLSVLKNSKYGVAYHDKLITNPSEQDYMNKWHCLSPNEFINVGGGVCYDFVEWESDYLKKHKIPFKKFHISHHIGFDKTDVGKDAATHSICVAIVNGKYVYIEGSSKKLAKAMGYIKEFNNIDELLDFAVKHTIHEPEQSKLIIIDYTNVDNLIGLNLFDYQNIIFSKGKVIESDFIQEGAFQDLKNGVNPYSDDLVFHVSMDKHIDGQVWKPRVPDYLDPYNPEDTGFEDNTTPRICFSTSIEGALNGITVNIQRQSPDTFDKMYVYIPEKPWKEYKHKTNKQLVKDKLVYDANVTREVWIMEPVRMKLYGVIRVDQIADAKRKSVVPTSKGQKDTRNYFTYKWHWVVKPKVLKKATKFDYSPERVIDDLCIDVKKFKYGLIKDGRLMTGNVSDADYNKYWVFHSGETVDQAGGGNCYDMVEYEAGYLEAFGVPYKKYYMNFTDTKNTETLSTHTICVVPHNGKFIYIEQAFKRVVDEWGYERKKEFDKLTDIFEYVAEVTAEYENQDLNYGVWDYTNADIDYGTPIKNFMKWIMSKCKMIYDGEATKQKPIKEGYRMNRFGNRFYTEAKKEEEMLSDDMEDIAIGDLELDNDKSDDTKDDKISIKDTNIDDDESLPEEEDDDERTEKTRGPIDDVPEYLKDRLSDEDLEDFEQPDENLNADNVDLGQFGSDQSDVQNDYDPKEVELLMKLMASEADALGEYLDAAKETNVDVLRRLYADIGNEERFHMEQLLFAKSELTGEKYVPKDPEVKSEYEELLSMGMDEETAMQTAVDKCHIRGSISEDDEDERMELQADVETMEMTINMFNQLYDNVYTVMETGTPKEVDHAFEIFVEATYDATAASSAQSALSETKKFGPVQLIRTTLRFLVKTLMTIVRKFVSLCKRVHNRSREIKRFIKQYGFDAIFSSKTKLYFVNFNNPYLVDDSLISLLALSVDTVNASLRSVGFQEMQQPYKRNPRMNVGGNVKRGIELLNGVQLVKSAMVLPENEADRERIAAAFFGYSDQKGPDGKSINTVNRMQWICDAWCNFMEYVDKITTQFDSLAQQQQSVYYTDKAKYDTAMKGLETVTKTCKAVVSAMQYDIETMIKLNNDAATQAANMSSTAAADNQDIQQNPTLKQKSDEYDKYYRRGRFTDGQ